MSSDVATTITVPQSVVARLRLYKTGGRTYADVLEEFMDAVPPRAFLEWAESELRRPAVEFARIRKDLSRGNH